ATYSSNLTYICGWSAYARTTHSSIGPSWFHSRSRHPPERSEIDVSEKYRTSVAQSSAAQLEINPVFARPGEATSLPKFKMPQDMMSGDTAYQIVHDEAMLDGNSRLNLATFVSTWMDENAQKIYAETADKNMIDKDE